MPRTLVLGHRGARLVAPENTLPAFQAAIDQGADGIELDVQLSADGVPVVIHDFTLDKTTNGHGPVRAQPFSRLRELDAGGWFGDRGAFANTPIPTLVEALDLARGHLFVNVELKVPANRLRSDGLELKVAALIADRAMEDEVIVSSFSPASLWHFKRVAGSRVPIGLLYAIDQPLYLRHRWALPLLRPRAVHPDRRLVTDAEVRGDQARGLAVNVWTVNDPIEMERFFRMDVDGLITDEPDRALAVRDRFAATPS